MNETDNVLDFQDLLERSWQEIMKRFLPFFLLAACAPAASWLIQGILVGFDPVQAATTQPKLWQSLTASLLSTLLSSWFVSALILYICKHTQNLTESWALAFYRLPRLILGTLLYILVISVGAGVAFAICWIILYLLAAAPLVAWGLVAIWILFFILLLLVTIIYWIFVPYLLLLTDLPLVTCFSSSYQLVKGHFWHTVGLLFILLLISIIVSIITMLAIGLLGAISWILLPVSRYIVGFLAIIPVAFLTLVYQVPLIALYLDLSPKLFEPTEQK